jgi:hypothetical protein
MLSDKWNGKIMSIHAHPSYQDIEFFKINSVHGKHKLFIL